MESLRESPHILIVHSSYHKPVMAGLLAGAQQALEAQGVTYEVLAIPGVFEIPGAIKMSLRGFDFYTGRRRVDGYVALGCVVRGETTRCDHVARETFRGLQDLVLEYSIALGNGILVCESEAQAVARAGMDSKNKGAEAAQACLSLLTVKQSFGLYPRD